jgi:glycosyltransferase involved in cell wall biosynthesis
MKIAILGTRGIPNYYGGYEQFAEYFSVYLVQKGHEVYCYNSHNHPFQEKMFQGVHIVHQKDPEHQMGTMGQFIYDYNCVQHARKQHFDIILQLGYTSSSIWYFLMPKKALIVTNMDGLEWKRSKFNKIVQNFLHFAESLAVKHSDYLIADSIGIQSYLKKTYQKEAIYIAYGANTFENTEVEILQQYNVIEGQYNMLIARFEPENNLQMILDGVVQSNQNTTFLVIGKHETKYGEFLKIRYRNVPCIQFLGAIYDINHLNNLRFFSNLYFHGHSVGGTNPSLLEAMASKALIAAHRNEFNQGVLKQNAHYFSSVEDVKIILEHVNKQEFSAFIQSNYTAIINDFNWDKINGQYLQLFEECMVRLSNRD